MSFTLGDRITARRLALGLTQNDVERRMGKGKGYLSTMLKRGSDPRGEQLALLAGALDCDLGWLATGRGSAHPSHPEPPIDELAALRRTKEADAWPSAVQAAVETLATVDHGAGAPWSLPELVMVGTMLSGLRRGRVR